MVVVATRNFFFELDMLSPSRGQSRWYLSIILWEAKRGAFFYKINENEKT
jgi:hypothetical protein